MLAASTQSKAAVPNVTNLDPGLKHCEESDGYKCAATAAKMVNL